VGILPLFRSSLEKEKRKKKSGGKRRGGERSGEQWLFFSSVFTSTCGREGEEAMKGKEEVLSPHPPLILIKRRDLEKGSAYQLHLRSTR